MLAGRAGVLLLPAGHQVAHPLPDVHRVVADPLVVAAHQGELHRGLQIEPPLAPLLQQHLHESGVQGVEPVVDVVEGPGQALVLVHISVHSQPGQPQRLVAHLRDQTPDPGRELGPEHPPGALADVAGQVADALQLRRDPDGGQDAAQVDGHGLLEGQQQLAALLDLHRGGIEPVVAVDDLLGRHQVAVQQGLGGPGPGLGGRRAQLDDLVPHRVEVLVERPAGLFGHGGLAVIAASRSSGSHGHRGLTVIAASQSSGSSASYS